MSLWAPNATLTRPADVHRERRRSGASSREVAVFQPENHWVSDTPAYKIRITVNGDKGTLYFECHYVDSKQARS